MYKKDRQGFTLVEILVVVAILSILASISLLLYKDYRIKTAKKVLLSDTKNCLNICVAKLSDDNQSDCLAKDCPISQNYTNSCTPDLNGPIYVKCEGKGIIEGYSCMVYQNGQIICS